MSPPTTTQRLLLLDADVVIEAHRVDVWGHLQELEAVAVPSIVAREEALFYSLECQAVPKAIHLPRLIQEGKILELHGMPEELDAVSQIFNRVFLEGLHEGEMEALALVLGGRFDLKMCSGDKMAIQALSMVGRGDDGVSLQEVLRTRGLTRPLEYQFTQEYFERYRQLGFQKRLTGEGLRS